MPSVLQNHDTQVANVADFDDINLFIFDSFNPPDQVEQSRFLYSQHEQLQQLFLPQPTPSYSTVETGKATTVMPSMMANSNISTLINSIAAPIVAQNNIENTGRPQCLNLLTNPITHTIGNGEKHYVKATPSSSCTALERPESSLTTRNADNNSDGGTVYTAEDDHQATLSATASPSNSGAKLVPLKCTICQQPYLPDGVVEALDMVKRLRGRILASDGQSGIYDDWNPSVLNKCVRCDLIYHTGCLHLTFNNDPRTLSCKMCELGGSSNVLTT